MHELSIALNILDIAAEESERRGGSSVKAIYIKLGPLSGVVPQALQSAFELARESGPLSDAKLVIEETPVIIYCTHCQAERLVESIQQIRCSECGKRTGNVVSGRELEIVAMEIEVSNSDNGESLTGATA